MTKEELDKILETAYNQGYEHGIDFGLTLVDHFSKKIFKKAARLQVRVLISDIREARKLRALANPPEENIVNS